MSLPSAPRWSLGDLYASPQDPVLKQDLDKLKEDAALFAQRFTPLSQANLSEAIKAYEALEEKLGKIHSYADLLSATALSDSKIQRETKSLIEKVNAIQTDLLFFPLEVARREDLKPEGFYAPWIRNQQKAIDHLLDTETEKKLHAYGLPAREAWLRLYEETLAGLRVQVGEEALIFSQALDELYSPDRSRRAQVGQGISETLRTKGELIALIFNTLLKEKSLQDRWRNYSTSMAERHLANDVTQEMVNAMEEAYRQSLGLVHRYYTLKAKVLGYPKLAYTDRLAPVSTFSRNYTWEEARDFVLDAYNHVSPKFREIGHEFFEKNWIDAEAYEGKDSGAFSHPVVPSVHPYILMNFYGKNRDVMILAHELGHGIHQQLAKKQGALMADTPLTLAETASIFGEMITFEKLLKNASENEKKSLLAEKIEDTINSSFRQLALYEFEKKAHHARAEGEISLEALNQLWIDVQREVLGEAVDLSPEYEPYWMYISHVFHTPFYVYAYAFGEGLVNVLYQLYKEHPEGFIEKYEAFLAAGGSRSTKELLDSFGLDANTPTFWAHGLKPLEQWIEAYEKLVQDSR